MPYSTSVKYFHSGMAGAPSITGTAGTLLAVLDACLVNGFGSQTVTIAVASSVATVTLSNVNANPFDDHTVASVSGATPSGLNGEKRVLTKTPTGFTFDATGVADGTATGTISAKLAGAGWTKLFSGTNLAAYQSSNVASTKCVLRVDDTDARNARVVSYDSMTDVNTGIGPCPMPMQLSGGLYWPKASTTSGSGRAWILVADDRTVYFKINTLSAGSQECGVAYGAGDFSPARSSDAFAFFVIGMPAEVSASNTDQRASLAQSAYGYYTSEALGTYLQKSYTGIGSAVFGGKFQEAYALRANGTGSNVSGQVGAGGFVYPNAADNTLVLSPYGVYEGSPAAAVGDGRILRGRLRGALFACHQFNGTPFAALDKVDGAGSLAGRKLLAVKGTTPAVNSQDGSVYFFDITGPWS